MSNLLENFCEGEERVRRVCVCVCLCSHEECVCLWSHGECVCFWSHGECVCVSGAMESVCVCVFVEPWRVSDHGEAAAKECLLPHLIIPSIRVDRK